MGSSNRVSKGSRNRVDVLAPRRYGEPAKELSLELVQSLERRIARLEEQIRDMERKSRHGKG